MIDVVELTRTLIRFDTVNPPGNEQPCAEYLGSLLEAAGFVIRAYSMGEGRVNLVARIGGSETKPPLCFSGHLDVVPLGAAPWTFAPFGGEIAGGRIYGRGASDMKSGVAAFVAAVIELAPFLHGTAGLELVITADEERSCGGANYLAGLDGALGRAGALIVAEPTANRPLVGHKGIMSVEGVANGVTAHASMPEQGENAIYKAARVISRLAERGKLHTGVPLLGGEPTFNVGRFQGGMNTNSVPDEARFKLDIRTVAGFGVAEVMAVLNDIGSDEVTFTRILPEASNGVDPAEPVWTDPHDPWVKSVFAVIADVTGVRYEPTTATYYTDAGALSKAYGRPPTLILGPGEPEIAHQTDEYCLIDRLEEATAAFTEIAKRWCGL